MGEGEFGNQSARGVVLDGIISRAAAQDARNRGAAMSRVYRLVALLFGAALCAALSRGCASGRRPATEVAVSGLGVLQGGLASSSEDVTFFRGIPYAKPPVGALRWQPPQEHGAWESPRDATAYGTRCMQSSGGSEDCLFLNVAAPTSALQTDSKLPVMLWIHGGAYSSGRPGTGITEGTQLVAASNLSVVVVTINYRLNIFGFLASADVQRSTSDGTAGNFGIQDQRMAMVWVQQHIAAFGGDGMKITIFGSSAGGNSVVQHLVQPASFPYFSKAAIGAGAYDGNKPITEAEAGYQSFLAETGCSDLACLRELDASTVFSKKVSGSRRRTWGPVVDGVWLTAHPVQLVAQGSVHKVPVLIGSARDECMNSWYHYWPETLTEAAFDSYATGGDLPVYGKLEEAKAIYNSPLYPYPDNLGQYSRWSWTLGRMWTDRVPGLGHCSVRWFARSLLAADAPAVYAWSYDHPPQKDNGMPGSGPGSVIASHSSEVLYVFGDSRFFTPGEEAKLGADMSSYWATFARTGDPNLQGLPAWPSYTAESDIIQRLDVGAGGIRTQQNLRKDACDFWEGLVDKYNFTSSAVQIQFSAALTSSGE